MKFVGRTVVLSLSVLALLLCWYTVSRRQAAGSAFSVRSSKSVTSVRLASPTVAQLPQLTSLLSIAPPVSSVILPIDSPASDHPVEQAVAKSRVLDERRESLPGGGLLRTRLVKASFRKDLLRVEEEWRMEAQGWTCYRRDMYLADQLILKTRPNVTLSALQVALKTLGMDFGAFIAPDTFTVRLREATLDAMPRALAALTANGGIVESAEADGVGFGAAVATDPNFTDQWGLQNTGQSGGTAEADVNATGLWDIMATVSGVTVAALDSGFNFTHPDLQGVAWTNPGEIAGDGIDNDGDGYIDDVNGWDFTNNDNDPTDDHGHGSNVSGIIAANRNNGEGISGTIGGVKIMVCKVLDSTNHGTESALLSAVTYARLQGVPIMNLSLQFYPFSTALSNEFNACQTAGILMCICAGNAGQNNDLSPNYPSCYLHTNIVAVGNHDRTDVIWASNPNKSNYGPTNVDLFAPGRDILGPDKLAGYSYFTGTSQATPFVTAVAAAIKYVNPDWKSAQIKTAIMSSVTTKAAYTGKCVSGGRLNALKSVAYAIKQEPTNDPDGDKVSNLFEYLAGTRLDDNTSQPVITSSLESGYLHLKMPRITRTDAHFEVEKTADFSAWTKAGVTDFSTTTLQDGGIPVSGNSAGYLRVKAVVGP